MQTTKTLALDRLFAVTTPGIWSPAAHAALRWAAASTIGHSDHLQGLGLMAPGARYEQDGNVLIQIIDITDLSNEQIGLMAITTDGALRYTQGMRTNGAAFAVGPAEPDDEVIFVVQGYRTAAAIYTAMKGKIRGYGALCSANMYTAISAARRRHPNAFILVCADDDAHGRLVAKAATSAVKGIRAVTPKPPSAGEPSKPVRHFADLFIEHGQELVYNQIAAAITQALEANTARKAELNRLQALVQGNESQTTGTD